MLKILTRTIFLHKYKMFFTVCNNSNKRYKIIY